MYLYDKGPDFSIFLLTSFGFIPIFALLLIVLLGPLCTLCAMILLDPTPSFSYTSAAVKDPAGY